MHGLQSGAGSAPGEEPLWRRYMAIHIETTLLSLQSLLYFSHQVAINSASSQGSVSFTGSSSGSVRPDLAGLLQGLLQDEGGRPAIEAVVAEEEDFDEEYEEEDYEGEYGEEVNRGEDEEDCKSWREGQGVPGEIVGRGAFW